MTSHGPVARAHRSHVQAGVGVGTPCHVAVAVRTVPTWGVPVITGPVVICGMLSARARLGAVSTINAAALPTRTARPTSIFAILLRDDRADNSVTWTFVPFRSNADPLVLPG
jgi:hypothetical protein